jgi:uncharacterized cofD-like protein
LKRTVTVIGGGTGSFHVLSGLRRRSDVEIRSIVTMMDSGGDSGRLRDEFGLLPPGDLRRCLVALSDESALLRDLFNFRFAEEPLAGRSFGNLFVLALTRTLGSEKMAIEALSRLLDVRGQVLPVTWDHAHLLAELTDGSVLRGEANIGVPGSGSGAPIRRVSLEPQASANPDAVRAILASDFLVLAPGDLYTSSIPNLLVEGIAEAIQRSPAPLIYIANLMTRDGETTGYTASRHVAELARYAGRVPDAVLVHRGGIPDALVARYQAEDALPVEIDEPALRELGVGCILHAPLISGTALVRHDPDRTADALEAVFERLAAGADR